METHSREGIVKKEKFANTRKPSHWPVSGSFGISEGNITGRKKKTQNKCLNRNSQRRSSPDARHQQAGAEPGGAGYMLRVRTRPECPESNLSELMR